METALRLTRAIVTGAFFACVVSAAIADDATKALALWSPSLYRVYVAYESYHASLGGYARHQGFHGPIEQLGTVVHEIIHLDSFRHQGFFVNGSYYEPYLRAEAWPDLTNEKVAPRLLPRERGIVFDLYIRNTPRNHLGNIADEINAYGHVLPFICRHEPTSTGKQARALIGFLYIVEGYLRTLRTLIPGEYLKLAASKETRGALILIIERAWAALRQCGIWDAAIPAHEASEFIAKARLTGPATSLQERKGKRDVRMGRDPLQYVVANATVLRPFGEVRERSR